MTSASDLSVQRSAILEEWFQVLIDIFPPDKSRFLQTSKDQFANPVGYRLKNGLAELFDELLKANEMTRETYAPLLDRVIRVQAVQGFEEQKVTEGVLALKRILREKLQASLARQTAPKGGARAEASIGGLNLKDLEARIDILAREAGSVHQACRKQLDELKNNEYRRRTYMQRRMGRDTASTAPPVAKGGNGS